MRAFACGIKPLLSRKVRPWMAVLVYPTALLPQWPEPSCYAAIRDDRKNKHASLARDKDPSSKLQSRLARGIRQRGDATVIPEARAVERDRLDAGGPRLFGDGLAHRRGGGFVLGAGQPVAKVLLDRGSGRDHGRTVGGDHLRVEVLPAAVYRQARHRQLADACARGLGAAQTRCLLVDHGSRPSSLLSA